MLLSYFEFCLITSLKLKIQIYIYMNEYFSLYKKNNIAFIILKIEIYYSNSLTLIFQIQIQSYKVKFNIIFESSNR